MIHLSHHLKLTTVLVFVAWTLGIVLASNKIFECYNDSHCLHDGKCIIAMAEDVLSHIHGEAIGGYCQCAFGCSLQPDCSGEYCPKECLNGGSCTFHCIEHNNT
jgi:hypothetical protein